MSELKFGIIGASGKVGKEITALLIEKKLIPFLGIYGSNEPTNFTHKAKEIDVNLAKQVDLWIDFSLPESFERFIPIASKLGKPVVSGTTGLSDKQKIILRDASNHCPILWSANMSIGINVLLEAIESLKKVKHFDFQIEEFHHNKKKDSPSGTAVILQDKLLKTVEKEIPSPLSVRGGGIFGIHKIWSMSDQEIITFEHQALNRRVFAEGAIHAALQLSGKANGLYAMKDVL